MGAHYTLAVLDLQTGTSEILINAAGNWEHPSWAPDGRHIVVAGDVKGKKNLYIVDSKTKRIRGLLGGKYGFSMPAW
jgi:Tol biopolymer transport system component